MSKDSRVARRKSAPRWEPALQRTERDLPDDPRLVAALAEVRSVFASRPRPYGVSYCTHCFSKQEMDAFLATPPGDLDSNDFWQILASCYGTWGDWPALAHYVPRLLELCARGGLDVSSLFMPFVEAAPPRRDPANVETDPDSETMLSEEYQAIFQFFAVLVHREMENPSPKFDLHDLFGLVEFLAAFHPGLVSLIDKWRASPIPIVRGRFCHVLASLAVGPREVGWGHFHCHIAERTYFLPENGEALAGLLDPQFVADYLLAHADEATLLDDPYDLVGIAFNWAVSAMAADPLPTAPKGAAGSRELPDTACT
jgi:hypothetical protein